MRLTDLAIQKLPLLEKGQKTHWDKALPGFGVRVGARTKAFVVMFGKERRLKTIGKYPDISLKDARQSAREILAKPPEVSAQSDADALTAFLEDCAERLRPSTVERYTFALAAHRETIDLTTNNPNELKALKVFYNWCIDHGIRDRNPLIRRKVVFAVRDRLLTDKEVKAVYNYEREPYSTLIRLLLLTGQRRGQFANFDTDWIVDDVIIFPASIMKTKRQHIIPATPTVLALIPKLGSYGGWSKSKKRMDEKTKVENYVLHDFRRFFSTTMAQLGVPLHLTEQIIDHRTQVSGVAEIYNLYKFIPEMRTALETYEAHISKITSV